MRQQCFLKPGSLVAILDAGVEAKEADRVAVCVRRSVFSHTVLGNWYWDDRFAVPIEALGLVQHVRQAEGLGVHPLEVVTT